MAEVGERWGGWIVEGALGPAGVASVHRVRAHDDAQRLGALKVLTGGDASTAERLLGLRQPGLAEVLDARLVERPAWLVTALVEGEKLSTRVREVGPLAAVTAQPLFETLAAAVATLHAAGLSHGDLKPQNVVLQRGTPVLVDLGLGVEASAAARAAAPPRVDTVSYVPPEWSSEGAVDAARWDVYALGALFWEVLVGRRAFALADDTDPAGAVLQVMADKRAHPPLDPGPDTPFFLRVLIRDMTHPDPSQRPASAGEVLIRLQAGEAGSLFDPIELFRTPMPAWQADEAAAAPGRVDPEQLSSSMVPAAPNDLAPGVEPAWWRSFASGAIAGGFLVALLFVAALGWALGAGWVPFATAPAVPPVP